MVENTTSSLCNGGVLAQVDGLNTLPCLGLKSSREFRSDNYKISLRVSLLLMGEVRQVAGLHYYLL
jgi:hypothetical protein